MRRFKWKIPAMALAALALACAGASAQTARSGGNSDTARLMQQMQQLAAERTQLQSENARLKQENDTLKKQAGTTSSAEASLKQKTQAAEANASRLAAANTANAEKLAHSQEKMDALIAKFRETAQALKDAETERNALRAENGKADRDLAACAEANGKLIGMNGELLDRLEKTGLWTKLAADEPFTRLKRTELENLAADYRARAAELTVAPLNPAPAATP